ncbi:MAG: hypothetical protein JWO41_502 [Candidatus Saccharibacteria bacterium]|nr:hypothetical protein [Candidatus Saccharibacteria bacterium]
MSRYFRMLALYGGMAIVLLWTLLRCITNGVNFDVVGQIGLAQQWAHGQMDGSQLGATNYLLKVPAYFLINQFQALPPLYRITLLAILFNLLTFFLFFKLYEKFLELYDVKDRRWFYLAFIWLATIAGNTFWIDYANSRNLETAGGLFFVYLVLRYLKHPHWKSLLGMGLTGAVVFFADPLQFYVCGIGSCVFIVGRLLLRHAKSDAIAAALVTGVTVLAYDGAKLLTMFAKAVFHTSMLAAPSSHPGLTVHYVLSILGTLVTSTLTIFDANFLKGAHGPLLLRELLNAALLGLAALVLFRHAFRWRKVPAYGLALTLIGVNYLVYIASGQVTQWQTARYLVMVPLLAVLMVSVLGESLVPEKLRRRAQPLLLLALACSTVLLLGALALNWSQRYSKDTHIATTLSFMRKGGYQYALASREMGITGTYFSDGAATILPMGCDQNHTLQPTNLFFDNGGFKGLYSYSKDVPILIGPQGITFGAITCSQGDIVAQFGAPKRLATIPGVGTILVYNAASLRIKGIDDIVGHPRRLTKAELVEPTYTPATTIKEIPQLPALSGCSAGTIDTVVAHPDDDILFMNPRLAAQLLNSCVRTIYVTAADDGRPPSYWLGRQHGIEDAYALMLGADSNWTDAYVTVNGHRVVTRELAGHPSVNLMFLRLPDGNVHGQGFIETGSKSLEKLSHGGDMKAIDGSTSYTYPDLVTFISDIFRADNPKAIYTHLADGPYSIGDHSDHRAVGAITLLARSVAQSNAVVSQYVGYPSGGMEPNVSTAQAEQKRLIFNAYAADDGVICVAQSACSTMGTYGRYFTRSYSFEYPPSAATTPTPAPKKIVKRQHPKTHSPIDLLQRTIE